MTKRDVAEALGKEMINSVAQAAREVAGGAGEKPTGHAKALDDLLNEVVGLQQTVNIRIFRMGSGLSAGKEEYITSMNNTDPQSLRDGGIEPLIQNACGGGEYRLSITAQGIPTKNIRVLIAGEPLPLKSERDAKAGTLPPWGVPSMLPDGRIGYNMAAPGVAQYLGLGPPQNAQSQSQSPSHISEAIMLAQFMASMNQAKQGGGGDSEEVKKLNETIAELKAANARAEADKARIESERKSDAQIAELKAQMEKMAATLTAAPKENPLLALAPTLLGVATEFMKAREAAATTQQTMITAMMASQKESSKESVELMKSIMLQPRESETDRMAKIMDIAATGMSTNMGLMQAVMNQMASMQPEGRSWWQEAVLNGIEQLGALGQMVMENRSTKRAEVEDAQLGAGEQAAGALPGNVAVEVLPPEEPSMMDAASAAAAAAQEQLGTPDMVESEARVAGVEPELTLPDFSAGAFKPIFEKIQDETADAHEVAFRVWKHATSGDRNALDWVQNPEEYTIVVLDTMARRGDLLLTAERIEEIVEAMVELYDHFAKGGTAESYLKRFSVNLNVPKNMVTVPLKKGPLYVPIPATPADEEEAEEAEPAEGGNGAAKRVAIAIAPEEIEKPKEPAVPTPSYGGAPPARGPV